MSRLVTSVDPGDAQYDGWDLETAIKKDNDPKKGTVIYLGGHSYGSVNSLCTSGCVSYPQTPFVGGERLVLNTLLFLGEDQRDEELARSSPVAFPDGRTWQGTYLSQAFAASAYPPVPGHFRQSPAGALASANVSAFASVTTDWDTAATGIPAAAKRTVFTAAAVSGKLARTAFTAANAPALATAMGLPVAAAQTAIDAIRAGGLGGIDHSTPAVVGPSAVAGSPARPTVAYVGGLDGMLHAIAIAGGGVAAGTELWAFVPPSQLPRIAGYQAGVDGSPQVSDAFVDDGTGVRSWRTLLAVTCGIFGGTVDVLDVTDPLAPAFLWEGASSSGGFAMGAASGAAFGMVQGALGAESVVVVATANAGTAGNGVNVYALDAGTGALVWKWNHLYSRTLPGTSTIVPNELPGVPAIADSAGDGSLDDRVYLGDQDGRLWELDARGVAPPPVAPLFDAGAAGQPIAASVSLHRDLASGHLAVDGATGGRDWVPAATAPLVFAIDTSARTTLLRVSLAAGERVYAAPTIAGNDLYLITSFGSFGGSIAASAADRGNLRRINLGSGAITSTIALAKSDSEVAVLADGSVAAASAAGESLVANANRDAIGQALNYRPRPFTVSAWLDLR